MKALVLGGAGFIGARIVDHLRARTDLAIAVGSRFAGTTSSGLVKVQVDLLGDRDLAPVLQGFDVIVNCTAGDARLISEGTKRLCAAARHAGCSRLVHLSSMAVYGGVEGTVDESSPWSTDAGWYGEAKREAEAAVFASTNGSSVSAVTLRPGCVFGPGSMQWVGRLASWLKAGRLGDLGTEGDGWSNLVTADDVARAVDVAIRVPLASNGAYAVFNLAAPDSPRWNEYFTELALAIGATPVKRLSRRRLALDAKLLSPPLKIAEKLLAKAQIKGISLPEAMPPSLTRLWRQQIKLDSSAASARLGMQWTRFEEGVLASAQWFRRA